MFGGNCCRTPGSCFVPPAPGRPLINRLVIVATPAATTLATKAPVTLKPIPAITTAVPFRPNNVPATQAPAIENPGMFLILQICLFY